MLLSCLVLFYLTKKGIKGYIPAILIGGGALNFIDASIFYLLLKFNFDLLFAVFHKIFFKPGSWFFDSNIVDLYTSGFFYDTTVKIVVNTLIMALAVMVVGVYLYRPKIKRYIKKRKKRYNNKISK